MATGYPIKENQTPIWWDENGDLNGNINGREEWIQVVSFGNLSELQ